jgi:hypothetical protein
MKNLTSTLLDEQKKARAKPCVRLLVMDRLGPHQRLTWSKLYSDSSEDEPQAMVLCGDDSIVRVRSHAGWAQYQRVTDPTNGDQWASWSGGMGQCSTMNQMALCTAGSRVWWFYISQSDQVLYCRESTDYGATWGSAVTVHTCTGDYLLESVAAAHRAGTDPIVYYSMGDPNTGLSTDLYRRKRVSGAWQSAASWGQDAVQQVRGLSCHKTGDYNMLYGARVDGQGFGFEPGTFVWCLCAIVYGNGVDMDADTWSDPAIIERTDSGTAWAAAWPSLTYMDLFRALFTGYLEGEEYSRVLRMRGIYGVTFLDTEWTDPFPFKAEGGPFGMVLGYRPGGDGYLYAACSNAAYRASAAGAGTADLSERVVKYRLVDRWVGHKASGVSVDYGQLIAPEISGEVWLDNSDGALNELGSGDYAAFQRGSMVVVRRGYLTEDGDEYQSWADMWLEDYEYAVDFAGHSYVVVYTIGPWGVLSAMAAQRQYHWEEGAEYVWAIAQRLFALAGFRLMSQGEASSEMDSLKPAIVIHPGQDLRGAVLSVLSKVPDFVYWEGSTAYVKELKADEASDYSYGGDGNHVIVAGRYGMRTPAHNHIEVFAGVNQYGIPIFGDEVDYDEVDLVGHRLQKVFDYGYADNEECEDRAEGQSRKHDATKSRGELVTLPNVGLELFDVVTVNDARCGVEGEVYRVRGIEEVYDTTKDPLIFRQKVTLGAR